MKRRIIALLCVAVMLITCLAGCSQGENSSSETDSSSTTAAESTTDTGSTEGIQADDEFYAAADLSILEGKKIGITVQSLQNSYWAGVMTAVEEVLEEAGVQVTIVSCDDSSATQIGQIENFVSSGCDLIMVHPSDATAIEDACAEAREAGIKVMCWDDPMTNTDGNWVLNNTDLGIAIGEAAGEFINEYYSEDNKAQVAMINYPQTTILLEREEGIIQGLDNTCEGKYEIISSQAGLDSIEAQTAMETILQRYPDCKIVVGIGSGAMIGADEALQISTGGDIPEDMGVFTADVTTQQLTHLLDSEYPARVAVGFEGSDEDTANACAAMFALILSDSLESQNVFRELTLITADNAESIM
ncbi:MAG: sugar ABC transporter substrate-binding protein [Lachnospiraceae bacterium]|nr:sugar ABC transporter substrate-binding protein [Lachnospiraceae bacterium]